MTTPPALPKSEDESHLDALAITHYVLGGIGMLFACTPLLHMTMGLFIIFGGDSMTQEMGEEGPPFEPALIGWFFFLIGGLFFLLGQAISITILISGRFLKARSHYNFSFVIACIACVLFPFGTALGIFSIIVLSRPSVKLIYKDAANQI